MITFNPAHKGVLDDLLLGLPAVRSGKMFGFPAYYAGKKLCICLYENGVGIKVPESTVQKLLQTDPNALPFQPLGKHVMREWVQIDQTDSTGYLTYLPLFQESVNYVLALQMEGKI